MSDFEDDIDDQLLELAGATEKKKKRRQPSSGSAGGNGSSSSKRRKTECVLFLIFLSVLSCCGALYLRRPRHTWMEGFYLSPFLLYFHELIYSRHHLFLVTWTLIQTSNQLRVRRIWKTLTHLKANTGMKPTSESE